MSAYDECHEQLLPSSSEFFPAGENWMPFGTNATNTQEFSQPDQQASKPGADSLLAQHQPSNQAFKPCPEAASCADSPPAPQRSSQHRSSSGTQEQFFCVHNASEHAAALQQLRTSGCFSMQFLEPPNSHVPSGQLLHPSLVTQPSTLRASAAAAAAATAAATDKTATLASMPHNTSLIRAGAPMLNTLGLMTGLPITSLQEQQQQPQSPTQQLYAAHLATAQQQQQQQHPPPPSRQQSRLSSPGKHASTAGATAPGGSSAARSVGGGSGEGGGTARGSAAGGTAADSQHAGAAAGSEDGSSQQIKTALRSQHEAASLSVQLSLLQAELCSSQAQVSELSTRLAAAVDGKAALQEQLEHLGVKAHSQESQLEFAHQQLDMRAQELRAAAQLQDTLHSLTEQLNRTRQEAEAVAAQQASDAADARRWAGEADSLAQQVASLTADLEAARQQLAAAQDAASALQQQQGSTERRVVELEGGSAELSQQLTAARDRAALLEAQNQRMNQELSAAEAAHHKLTQQLSAADLQNTKLAQQLATIEASQNRSGQQLAAADAQNAKLLQQLSAAEAEIHALRSQLGGMHASQQQSEVACEQLRQLQGDHQRQVAQLRAELAEASQEILALRSQNDTLSQRLNAADGSNTALQAGLDRSWASARAADRAAQETKQQLMQAQQQVLQLRQQLLLQQQQGPASGALSLGASGYSAGLMGAADGYGGLGLAGGLGAESSRARLELGPPAYANPSVYASQDWNSASRSSAASLDGPSWANQQQQQAVYGSLSSSPDAHARQAAARAGQQQQQQQQQPVSVSRSVEGPPWFAGGGGRVGSTQQISSHLPPSTTPQVHSPTPAPASTAGHVAAQQYHSTVLPQASTAAGSAGTAALHHPSAGHGQMMPPEHADVSRGRAPSPQQLQASAADLGYSGSALPLSRDMLSVVEVMAATKQLEDQLLDLSQERDELEKELAKMPPGAGRTIKGRQRKMVVEQRLDDLGVEISRVRIEIKKLNGQTKR